MSKLLVVVLWFTVWFSGVLSEVGQPFGDRDALMQSLSKHVRRSVGTVRPGRHDTSLSAAERGLRSASTYDPEAARRAMWHTKVSGCDPDHIQQWSCVPCANVSAPTFVVALHNHSLNAQGYVGYWNSTGELWVAFRGSRTTLNWIYDFDFLFQSYWPCEKALNRTCNVHQGFFVEYGALNATLLPVVAEVLKSNPSVKIHVTGHSLGAAMATLAAVQLETMWPGSVASLTTVGSPRVGDFTWTKWVAESVLNKAVSVRLTHQSDPVPKLPLIEMGFLHIPHEVWYPYGGETVGTPAGQVYRVCDDSSTSEDMQCSDSVYLQEVVPDDHMYIMGIHLACNDGE